MMTQSFYDAAGLETCYSKLSLGSAQTLCVDPAEYEARRTSIDSAVFLSQDVPVVAPAGRARTFPIYTPRARTRWSSPPGRAAPYTAGTGRASRVVNWIPGPRTQSLSPSHARRGYRSSPPPRICRLSRSISPGRRAYLGGGGEFAQTNAEIHSAINGLLSRRGSGDRPLSLHQLPQLTSWWEDTCPQTTDPAQDSDDSFMDETDTEKPPTLDPKHRFAQEQDALFHQARKSFTHWTQDLLHHYPQNPLLLHPQERPTIACPYFRKDPHRHWSCLVDPPPHTMPELKRHLYRRHTQPYYCPVCFTVFPLASTRDAHMVERSCAKKEVVRFEGMTAEQRALVFARPREGGVARQWARICAVLFGKEFAASTSGPFLSRALSWRVSLAGEYWGEAGLEMARGFLVDRGVLEGAPEEMTEEDRNALVALGNAVYRDLVAFTFWGDAGERRGCHPAPFNYPSQDCLKT